MTAVADSGPLIHLSWIDRLDFLEFLFDEVVVPTAVRDQVLAPLAGTIGLHRLQQMFASRRLRVVQPTLPVDLAAPLNLDPGETEAILLAQELRADAVITDDAIARAAARDRGFRVVGTIGILTDARDRGLIPAALPLVLELRRVGQWIGDALVERVRAEEEGRSS